jgi:hypothetical protein
MFTFKRRLSAGEVVQHAAEAEQVGAMIDGATGDLLGGHVTRRAENRARLRQPSSVAKSRAKPKSRILTRCVFASIQMLSGLMSR